MRGIVYIFLSPVGGAAPFLFIIIMPNHGKCKNCWWCRPLLDSNDKALPYGLCFMHNSSHSHATKVSLDSYCPDYTNRKQEEKYHTTLADHLERNSHYRVCGLCRFCIIDEANQPLPSCIEAPNSGRDNYIDVDSSACQYFSD